MPDELVTAGATDPADVERCGSVFDQREVPFLDPSTEKLGGIAHNAGVAKPARSFQEFFRTILVQVLSDSNQFYFHRSPFWIQ